MVALLTIRVRGEGALLDFVGGSPESRCKPAPAGYYQSHTYPQGRTHPAQPGNQRRILATLARQQPPPAAHKVNSTEVDCQNHPTLASAPRPGAVVSDAWRRTRRTTIGRWSAMLCGMHTCASARWRAPRL